MKEITKVLYLFGELLAAHKENPKAFKASAVDRSRQWLIEGVGHFQWWDFTWETWKNALDQIGFTDADMNFSGFYSQGDGASFTAKVDMGRLVEFLSTAYAPDEAILGTATGEEFRPWIIHKIGPLRIDPQYSGLMDERLPGSFSAEVVRKSHQYSHEYTCKVEFEWEGYEGDSAKQDLILLESFMMLAEDVRVRICKAIYKDLEEEWEYRTADAQLIEDSEANEYYFDQTGRREG